MFPNRSNNRFTPYKQRQATNSQFKTPQVIHRTPLKDLNRLPLQFQVSPGVSPQVVHRITSSPLQRSPHVAHQGITPSPLQNIQRSPHVAHQGITPSFLQGASPLQVPSQSIQTPRQVTPLPQADPTYSGGKYAKVTDIGNGAFGSVIKAKCISTQKVVAIKMIEAKRSDMEIFFKRNPKKIEDAFKEIKVMFQLNHPNIINCLHHYQYNTTDGAIGVGIVMEFCSRGSLQYYLTGLKTPLDKSQCYKWYMELTIAIKFIHDQKIVHRDIKPDNILIGDDNRIKIADVGIAKAAWDIKPPSLQQQLLLRQQQQQQTFNLYMTTVAGTKPFIAPEVYSSHYTKECDVFSLGLVFWIMAATPNGNLVPQVKGIASSLGEYLKSQRPAPKASRCGLHPPLHSPTPREVELFDKMLTCDYKSRATTEDVLKDVTKMQAVLLIGD